jgi:ribokinase
VAAIVVVGQIARDLVLVVDEVPGPGNTAAVRARREMLGGKGANQAVALAQLGLTVALVGVVGDDSAGEAALRQAERDGIDISAAVRRDGTATGLIVDIVDRSRRWRYLEDLPRQVLVTEADIAAAAPVITAAQWVSVQLQQPPEAALAAVRCARRSGSRVVLDGVPPEGPHRAPLLAGTDVLRADAREAELLTGTRLGSADETGQGRDTAAAAWAGAGGLRGRGGR